MRHHADTRLGREDAVLADALARAVSRGGSEEWMKSGKKGVASHRENWQKNLQLLGIEPRTSSLLNARSTTEL